MKPYHPVLMVAAAWVAAWLIDSTSPPASVAKPAGSSVSFRRYRGVAIQVDTSHRPLERYGPMIHEVADLGADTVLFSVNGYQDHAGSADIRIDQAKTPSDAVWLQLFEISRTRDLRIVLMPKILLSRPRGREWRGVINPGQQWSAWFDAYSRFILHYARVAAAGDVEVFVVGSELLTAERHTARWRRLIAEVRGVFSGKLTYSANWDHYRSVQFWDELDLVGMTTYYQTAARAGPELHTLVSAWRGWRRDILDWHAGIGKPLLFTEVGWCSQEGCSVEPWNYYRQPAASAAGLREQRLNYEAFIQTWSEVADVAGIIWWEWSHHAAGTADPTYTPKNKPAEAVLRAWFERAR